MTSKDICDEPHCYDQAEVRAMAKTGGYLEFCAHHYDRHLKTEKGARNMAAFAAEIIDERIVDKKEQSNEHEYI